MSLKNFHKIFIIICCLISFLQVKAAEPLGDSSSQVITKQMLHQIISLPIPEIEKGIGRKLRWSEKLAIKTYQKLPEKTQEQILADKRVNNQAVLAFILFAVGLFVFPLLFAASIPISSSAISNHKKGTGTLTPSNYTLAQIAFWGSIAMLILYLLIIVLVIVIITGVR